MAPPSQSFTLLDERIQRWVWERNWTELKDAQEKAIPVILRGQHDVIISAATAGGKTEAAFLPIASRLAQSDGQGLALYISPLKALINDQCGRLEMLFGICDLPVHPWHGDVPASRKTAFERDPRGVLLITPESLESLFVRRGFYLGQMFKALQFVVIDELHSFINTERGMQLASLLNRLEEALNRRVPRIGLSATLGDMRIAAEFLRPSPNDELAMIESRAEGQELRIQVKGYYEPTPPEDHGDDLAEHEGLAAVRVARDLYQALRGSKNLVFANSRRNVEEFTDRLCRLCEQDSRPMEFFAHHGSLSKSLREEVEDILREAGKPATAVCTSSLEMGIDIGQVKSVAQLDPPYSVASLRQRLGRSGRRGEPAILRMYVTEPDLQNHLALQNSLRLDLFQGIAAIELLLERWCEPPTSRQLHFSTLIQQVLSLVAQRGGVLAVDAWRTLCQKGPFRNVTTDMFVDVLRELGRHDLLMQTTDGTLLHGQLGEQIVNHYTFYTAFWTSEEFQIVHGHHVLGTLPVSQPVSEKSLILFGGRRWRVLLVDERSRTITVEPAQGGRAPRFTGAAGVVHRRIHEKMRALYQAPAPPRYLDAPALTLFNEGRERFAAHGLAARAMVEAEDGCLVFLWAGDMIANTLLVQLQSAGFAALSCGVAVFVQDATVSEVEQWLVDILKAPPPDEEGLADSVPNKITAKYDMYLPPQLLSKGYAVSAFDVEATYRMLQETFRRLTLPGNIEQ